MKKALVFYVMILAVTFVLSHPSIADDNFPEEATVIDMIESPGQVAVWSNDSGNGYSIKKANGQWHRVDTTSYDLKLRFAQFDPVDAVPLLPANLQVAESETGTDVYIVQFVTQPIEEYRRDITLLGGVIHKFLAQHSYLVQLDDEARDNVAQLPYVRWVGRYEPAYKLDEILSAGIEAGVEQLPAIRLNIMVFERGPLQKGAVATEIERIGGKVNALIPDGFRLEATLTGDQILAIASMPEVMWMDIWTDIGNDMDIVRDIGGANFIETVAGFTGQGVRGEACDSNLYNPHVEFQAIPPLFHGPRSGSADHGTSVYGICFAQGVNPQARGMLPDGQGLFADSGFLTNRYQHTFELTQSPYEAVFQTNSWGNSQTTAYTSVSAEMDDILFDHDIVITQSQSNTGNQTSRPQAWAKNIVAVGGIHHQNTLTRTDDVWGSASIGPAADGRIKPDLCHFYDSILTTDDFQNGYRNFGGTSGATPIVAGHFGLLFQMWSEGVFGNTVDPNASVFDNRCHAPTAKALMINQASSYAFSGTTHNLTRTHQGWGLPDLQQLYEDGDSTFVVNEDVVIGNLDTATFTQVVSSGVPEFKATLVYADPMGTTSSTLHRINDLTLKVTSPGGTVYWGNNGLRSGNWSTSGGSANTIDTVENVFVSNPPAGVWIVQVIASEINEDGHIETPAVDADFALVVTGINSIETRTVESFTVTAGDILSGGVAELQTSDDEDLSLKRGSTVASIVTAEMKTTTGIASPSELTFVVEASVFSRGLLTQTTSLFNYISDDWEVVDVRAAQRRIDQVISVDVSGDPSRFVQPGTGCMEAELKFQGPTVRNRFWANIDYLCWELRN